MQRTTLLCATDLRESGTHAADLAVTLARAGGYALELVHVAELGVDADISRVERDVRPAAEALQRRLRARVEELAATLERERKRCAAEGVECEASLEEGRPWEAIVEMATRREPQMVVVGPHQSTLSGHRGLGDRLLGTTASRVVRHAPCSVLVAGPKEEAPALHGATWLLGMDFSPSSVEALEEVVHLARATSGRLVLVHVLSAAEHEPTDEAPTGWDDLLEQWRRDAHARLRTEARQHASDLDVETRVEQGAAAPALARAADETDAAVLVVASHGHSAVARMLLGSTAERCLRHAGRPVLVVRRAELGRE